MFASRRSFISKTKAPKSEDPIYKGWKADNSIVISCLINSGKFSFSTPPLQKFGRPQERSSKAQKMCQSYSRLKALFTSYFTMYFFATPPLLEGRSSISSSEPSVLVSQDKSLVSQTISNNISCKVRPYYDHYKRSNQNR